MAKTPTPVLSAAQAAALLAKLVAEYGDGVVASLVGAAFAEDVANGTADYEDDDEYQPTWDLGWFCGFASTAEFVAAAGEANDRLSTERCEY